MPHKVADGANVPIIAQEAGTSEESATTPVTRRASFALGFVFGRLILLGDVGTEVTGSVGLVVL